MGKRWMALLLCAVFLLGCGRKFPVIYAPDARITVGESYEADDGVHALDAVDGDLTSQIRIVSGKLNVQKSGRYRIRYTVTNSRGASTKASRVIIVSNQSAHLWYVVLIVSLLCAGALFVCFVLWRGRKNLPPQEDGEAC